MARENARNVVLTREQNSIYVWSGDAMVGAKNQAFSLDGCPLAPPAPACRGAYMGGNKTGRSPFQRSCYVGNEAAKIKNPYTWSESIGRIRFRPLYAGDIGHPFRQEGSSFALSATLPMDCIWVLTRSVTVMFTSDCGRHLFRSAPRLYHSKDP